MPPAAAELSRVETRECWLMEREEPCTRGERQDEPTFNFKFGIPGPRYNRRNVLCLNPESTQSAHRTRREGKRPPFSFVNAYKPKSCTRCCSLTTRRRHPSAVSATSLEVDCRSTPTTAALQLPARTPMREQEQVPWFHSYAAIAMNGSPWWALAWLGLGKQDVGPRVHGAAGGSHL